MALSFFKKKAEETSEGLRINMPGAEKVPLATSVPAVPVRTGHNPAAAAKAAAQLPCDSIYAFSRNMLICPHCETIITDRKRHCPACGLYF